MSHNKATNYTEILWVQYSLCNWSLYCGTLSLQIKVLTTTKPKGRRTPPFCQTKFVCGLSVYMADNIIMPNLVKISVVLTWNIMTRSDHMFVHAITADVSWRIEMFSMIRSLEWKLKQEKTSQDYFCELINALYNGSMHACIRETLSSNDRPLIYIMYYVWLRDDFVDGFV